MGTAHGNEGHSSKASPAAVALPAAVSQTWFVVLPPFLPTIADAIGVSTALAGQIVGLPLLLSSVLILFVGPLIDAYGHPRVMMAGLATVAASSLGTALATDSVTLLGARLVGAFGRAGIIPAAFVDAVERPDQDQRRHGTGLVVAGAAAAPLIAVPVLTLVGAHAGWRSAFVLVSCLAALSAALAWRQARDRARIPTRVSPSARRSFGPLLSEPTISTVLASSLVGNAGVWVCVTYLGVLYEERLGRGAQDAGWALTAIGLGQLAGSLAAMDRRIGLPSRWLVAACRAGVGLAFGLPYVVSAEAAVVAALLFAGGVFVGVLTSITPLLLSRPSRSDAGTVQSLNWLALTAGIALGASLGGALLAAGDLPYVGVGTMGLSWLAAAVLLWHQSAGLSPTKQRHQH